MKKKPFEVGERVVCYGGWGREIRTIYRIDGDIIHFEHGFESHKKACRHIIRKKRRVIWLEEVNIPKPGAFVDLRVFGDDNWNNENFIKFVEVKE